MDKTEEEKKSTLEDRGIVFLTGAISPETVQPVIEKIIGATLKQDLEFIQLMVSSPGGSVDAGFALIDMMRWSRLPVYTTGYGLVASMGLAVLMAGEKGHRVVTPRCSLMSHRFWTGGTENYSGLVARRKIEDLTHQRIVAHYLECGSLKAKEEVESQLLRDVDTWMDASEAKTFGLIDAVHGERRAA
jgi:ATP-dependent Clp protease protease subunit